MKRSQFLTNGLAGLSIFGIPGLASAGYTQNNDPLQPFSIPPAAPLQPGPGNINVRTIIRSVQTGRQFSSVEVAVGPKQMGPSPHVHDQLDELMYVLEGTATVMIGKDIYEVKAGGWNFRPRRIPHSFWNASDQPLRFIDCFFQQDFENYLEELFQRIIPDMARQQLTPDAPAIAARIAALDQQYGVTWFHEQRQAIVDKYRLKG